MLVDKLTWYRHADLGLLHWKVFVWCKFSGDILLCLMVLVAPDAVVSLNKLTTNMEWFQIQRQVLSQWIISRLGFATSLGFFFFQIRSAIFVFLLVFFRVDQVKCWGLKDFLLLYVWSYWWLLQFGFGKKLPFTWNSSICRYRLNSGRSYLEYVFATSFLFFLLLLYFWKDSLLWYNVVRSSICFAFLPWLV